MRKLINLILNSKLLLPFAILCTLIIGYLSLSDISSFPKLEVKHEDKLYHVSAYFALNFVWLLAILPFSTKFKRINLMISLGIIVFGIVIEIFQEIFTDYRVFDYYDIAANSLGVFVSYLCFLLLKKEFFENINPN